MGFDAAFFLVKGLERSTTLLGLDEATRRLAIANGESYAKELMPVKRAALSARGVAIDTDVLGVRGVRKTRYYRELATTVGSAHSLMAYVPWGGRIVAAIMLGRGGRGFSRPEATLVESLLPTLGTTRAAFGLPAPPLPHAPKPSWLSRLSPNATPLASAQTRSGTVSVRDRAGFREMVAQSGKRELVWTRASLSDPTQSGWPYTELFHLAPALSQQKQSALFIGSGGAISLQQFAKHYPGIVLDLVEHEPSVITLAERWFNLGNIPNLQVHIADGVDFIAQAAPTSWDTMIVDAYDALSADPRFTEPTFLKAAHRALKPGGAIACNLIDTLSGHGPLRALADSARHLFDDLRIVPVVDPNEKHSAHALRNIVLIAARPL